MEFERVEIAYFNKQHLKRLEAVTFKYNRTTADAVVNATWLFNTDVGYNYDVRPYNLVNIDCKILQKIFYN